jgi:hypothetical protein
MRWPEVCKHQVCDHVGADGEDGVLARLVVAQVRANARKQHGKASGLAAQIESELRNKRPEHFVDRLSLADFYASLEHAADVLGQKGQRAVENTPAPVVKGSQVPHCQ